MNAVVQALPHDVCPCCGQRWVMGRSKADAKRLVYGLILRAEPQQRRLLEILVDHFGEWIPRAQLAMLLYRNDPDGGPLAAEQVAATRLSQLRKKIAPYGLIIEGRSWHGTRLLWAPVTMESTA